MSAAVFVRSEGNWELARTLTAYEVRRAAMTGGMAAMLASLRSRSQQYLVLYSDRLGQTARASRIDIGASRIPVERPVETPDWTPTISPGWAMDLVNTVLKERLHVGRWPNPPQVVEGLLRRLLDCAPWVRPLARSEQERLAREWWMAIQGQGQSRPAVHPPPSVGRPSDDRRATGSRRDDERLDQADPTGGTVRRRKHKRTTSSSSASPPSGSDSPSGPQQASAFFPDVGPPVLSPTRRKPSALDYFPDPWEALEGPPS